jgi:hypothetical protein
MARSHAAVFSLGSVSFCLSAGQRRRVLRTHAAYSRFPTFIDESADETRSSIVCVGALLASQEMLVAMTELQLKKLGEVDVECFRVTDCGADYSANCYANTVDLIRRNLRNRLWSGLFRKLIRKHGGFDQAKLACDGVQTDLENIRLHPL